MKLETEKILELTPVFWKNLGDQKIKVAVKKDMEDGVMQNDTSNHKYKSKQYKIYKNNDMRRLTTGEGKTFTDKSGYFFGTTFFANKKAGYSAKKNRGTGKRLKAYQGKTIESNTTTYVDMIVTGHTKKGLKVKKSNKTGVDMGFDPSDAKKILGNQERGYDIVGLNEKNINMVRNEILKQFDRNESKLKDINISVRL